MDAVRLNAHLFILWGAYWYCPWLQIPVSSGMCVIAGADRAGLLLSRILVTSKLFVTHDKASQGSQQQVFAC